jgi:glutaredoxin
MTHDNPVYTVIRGHFPCTFCDKAVAMLEEHSHPYVVQKLEMSDLIMKQAGYRHPTVPIILQGDQFIGGTSDLETHLNNH